MADKGETRASVVKIGGRPARGAHVTLGIAGFPNDYGEPRRNRTYNPQIKRTKRHRLQAQLSVQSFQKPDLESGQVPANPAQSNDWGIS